MLVSRPPKSKPGERSYEFSILERVSKRSSWHHDPPIPGLRPHGEAASLAHIHCATFHAVWDSTHSKRKFYHSTRLIGALRNMSGNAGAAAPRNGLAAGRTVKSAGNRQNIVERASGGGKAQGIVVDPRCDRGGAPTEAYRPPRDRGGSPLLPWSPLRP